MFFFNSWRLNFKCEFCCSNTVNYIWSLNKLSKMKWHPTRSRGVTETPLGNIFMKHHFFFGDNGGGYFFILWTSPFFFRPEYKETFFHREHYLPLCNSYLEVRINGVDASQSSPKFGIISRKPMTWKST